MIVLWLSNALHWRIGLRAFTATRVLMNSGLIGWLHETSSRTRPPSLTLIHCAQHGCVARSRCCQAHLLNWEQKGELLDKRDTNCRKASS